MTPAQRPLLTVSVGVAVAILITLGTWQVLRLQWKNDLIEMVAARTQNTPKPLAELNSQDPLSIEYTPVAVTGRFVDERVAYVFGTHDSAPGWFLFQSFLTDTGRAVLINRGFVPGTDHQGGMRATDEAVVTVTGLVRANRPPSGLSAALAPPATSAKGEFYTRDMVVIAAHLRHDGDSAFYIDRISGGQAGDLPLGGTTRLTFSNNHLGYAVTWFGLAAGLMAVYLRLLRGARSQAAA